MNEAHFETRPEQATPRALVCGWEVKSPPIGRPGLGWPELAAAVACWPGGPLSVERRFASAARAKVAREYVLVSGEGPALFANASELRRELVTLTAGVRRTARHRQLFDASLGELLRGDQLFDLAELRAIGQWGPEQEDTMAAGLDELLAALASLRQMASLSVLMGSSPPGSAYDDVAALRIWQQRPVALVELPEPSSGRVVRFRLRLASDQALPDSVLALAAAVAGTPSSEARDGWHRPTSPAGLRAAREEFEAVGARPWESEGSAADEPLVAVSRAAELIALPVLSERVGQSRVPAPAPGLDDYDQLLERQGGRR